MKVIRSVSARLALVILLCQSLVFTPVVYAAGNLALPTGDLVAPEIKHDPITKTLKADEATKIRATVTDNVGVKEVILFYRPLGSSNFVRMNMTRDMNTDDEYFATPPNIPEPGMEYYIQATDLEGNTLLRGHSFSPLTVRVEGGAPSSVDQTKSLAVSSGEEEKKGISKWVWIGLGALAVGAALAGGGSDGGGDETPPASTSGTIVISGPAP